MNRQERRAAATRSNRHQPPMLAALARHNELGRLYHTQGRLDAAIACYGQALALRPDDPATLNNLGLVLRAQGRIVEAVARFERALAVQPDWPELRRNAAAALQRLGDVLAVQGDTAEADARYARARGLDPALAARERAEAESLRKTLPRQLADGLGHTAAVSKSVVKTLRMSPPIHDGIRRAAAAWPDLPADLYGPDGLAAVARDGLLRTALISTPILGVEMERFLRAARAAMLDACLAAGDPPEPDILAFYCALAQQCFINEYVYAPVEGEAEKCRALRDTVTDTVQARAAPAALSIVALAAYVPLHALENARSLLDASWPAPVAALLDMQLREPLEERALAAAVPCLTPIEDQVSQTVRQHYEENPYPRWVTAAATAGKMPVDAFLSRKFPHAAFRPLGRSGGVDWLVAGCGTGQNSVATALHFSAVRVLAVDLSRTSLAYAMRKSRALELDTITYAQADILRLGTIGRRFDVIESTGVLHHLAEPMMGWQALRAILRPGGVMRLGLYSGLARRPVAVARAAIAARGFGAGPEDIRRFRQEVMAADAQAPLKQVAANLDFYSLSACRDFLFHGQESQLSLPEIKRFIDANNLAFLGFDAAPVILQRYRSRFPGDEAATDLESWHVFETENPDSFAAMYQFWVQDQGES